MTAKTIRFEDIELEITGLSIRKLSGLITAYPDLLGLLAGGFDLGSMIAAFPDAIQKIIAEGTRASSGVLERFDSAPAGEQIDLLSEIFDVTFQGGKAMPFILGMLGAKQTAAQ
jgi:hypothetical protein